MNVDFNNLRKQACHAYDKLCDMLNASMVVNETTFVEGYGWTSKGDIILNPDHIQEEMESLRSLIGSIAMVYEEGNEEFKEVYPEHPMAFFNPEEE